MNIFRRRRPNNVLFLIPVRSPDMKVPRGKIMMLYCDASGNVLTTVVSRSVYERAREHAEKMQLARKPYAILGIENGSGSFLPVPVEVTVEEAHALDFILDHALDEGRLPEMLKQYPKSIILRGEADRNMQIPAGRRNRDGIQTQKTPPVLNRLPYYSERDVEFSMPVYKAEYMYPLIILKHLAGEKPSQGDSNRLLVIDSEGDMAIVTVPRRLVENAEKEINKQNATKTGNKTPVISKNSRGMIISWLSISQQQKKALDAITKRFEETGDRKRPISAAARSVLVKANNTVSSAAD